MAAQDTLPVLTVKNSNGINLLTLSTLPNSVNSINIQRSLDQGKRFVTVATFSFGTIKNNYIDEHAGMVNALYRLFISFKGGTFAFTPPATYQQTVVKPDTAKKIFVIPVKTVKADSPTVINPVTETKVQQLKEVKVVTKVSLVNQDIDKLTYNIEGDPESKSMSALDMMRKIPLVIIDADDNIQVNGSTNFLVLVNGRRSSLFVRSPKDVFKSMPASSIKSIEIITNPSSRYEAEGVGGIINVITKKSMVNGYNGSANIILSSPKSFTTSGNLTAKTKKFGFSGYFGNTDVVNRSSSRFFRENFKQKNILMQSGESETNNSSFYFGTEFSYELDSMNLITANYNRNASNADNGFQQQVDLMNNNGTLLQQYSYGNTSETKWKGNDVGIDYQRNFKHNTEQLLTISYQLSNTNNANPTYYTQHKANNTQAGYSDNDDKYAEQTAQADYLFSINKKIIEFGIKSIFRNNVSDYLYKNQLPGSAVFIVDSTQSNNFNYKQSIYGSYASLSLKRKEGGIKIGVRLEQTNVRARFRSTATWARQNYLNLIPNITVSQKLKPSGVIRFSYTQRIERPGLFYLNPYIDISDPKNISYGNPEIRPAINNVFNVGYNTFVSTSSININAFHTFTNNSIQRYTLLGNDSIARTTFDNVGKNKVSGLSVNGMTTFFEKLSINLTGTLSHIMFRGKVNGLYKRNSGFVFNVFGYSSYRFNKGWRASATAGYNSPSVVLQGNTAGYTWNSFSVQKDFLQDNKASLSLSVTSPFNKYRRSFNEINDPDFYLKQESFFIVRRFNLSYNYRFGKLEDDIMRKKRGIKNDDLKTAEMQNIRN